MVVDVLAALSASVPLLLPKVMMEVMMTTSRRLLQCYQDGIPMYIWLAILVKQQFFPLSILLVHALYDGVSGNMAMLHASTI